MRYLFTLLFLLPGLGVCLAQPAAGTRIILIGNAADASAHNSHFLEAVRQSLSLDANTIVLFLGNNMHSAHDTAALRAEVSVVEGTDARAFFIPGYLDWDKGHRDGYACIRAEQSFIKSLGNKSIKFYPSDGCPGPKKIELDNDAVMYIMDSQWWLHEGIKPDIQSDCKYRTKEDVLAEIEDIPKEEFEKLVLFVTHHPLENTGVHSGTFGIKQHLFPLTDIPTLRNAYVPLPVIGSLYPIVSNAISSSQDLQNREYQSLAKVGISTSAGITSAFRNHPNTVFIAGQEQNLQLLKKDNHYFINSGATGIPTRVRESRHAEYVRQQRGITVLEISPDKKLSVRFLLYKDGHFRDDFVKELLSYDKLPPIAKDTATLPFVTADSTVAVASRKMAHPSWLMRALNGYNYRDDWAMPVKMKVLHLDHDKGGMKITGMGGGHESKSLQLKDANGEKWVFRTSNKNLNAVIPEGFQETVASDYIQDMLSASEPYGALVVTGLQQPLGIVQSTPQVCFVPNDSALGIYRPVFANNVGIMEERKPALNDLGQIGSTVALDRMVDAGDHFADQETYLKIRLIDFLIADFDRHHGQYSWGMIDSGGRTFYYPIPKDRDQAFYHNKGAIMQVMKHGQYSFMVNFPYRIANIKNMGVVGAYLDVLFTNKLTAADWRTTIREFKSTLSDSVIDEAVRRFPPEIYQLRGAEISAKLRSRRESLAAKGMSYYRYISRKVNILGGNTDDLFEITGNDSGLRVQVFAKDSAGTPHLNYERTFDPHITKELRLYGFNGNDKFVVDKSARSHIRLRIVGGEGADTFNIKGHTRNLIYDLSSEHNRIVSRSHTTRMFANDPSVNEFKLRENRHNSFDLPLVTVGYNVEDGVIGGIGLAYRTYGFRKYPYASLQRFAASFASASVAHMIRYKGEFIDVYRHYDLLVSLDHYDPVLSNFFGYGNESYRDKTKPIEYYRTRYDYISQDLLFRRRFHKNRVMSISAGPSFYYYWYTSRSNEGRVLESPQEVGLDSASVYTRKLYAGGKVNFTINTLNNELVPTRGIKWVTDFTGLQSLNEAAKSLTKLSSTLDIYSELDRPSRLLAALHFGGGHIFSEHFEYFQALTLGGNNYLRGYRINRFAGASMAYGSAELKVRLLNFNAHILKGDLGLVGFNDIGRVWMPGEHSTQWHNGYGGGIYLTPFNALMISTVVGFSQEDVLFNLSIGTKLNMVFQGM